MSSHAERPVRYAVVGLGKIAQTAVLPAFEHAKKNARLVALVSGTPKKLTKLSARYGVERTYSYDELDAALASGEFDAVYVCLPNHLHHDCAIRAARSGIHVLCEKPLAVNVRECEEMIETARAQGVLLMTAYRLHFERTNLDTMEAVRAGKIGEPRFISSVFSLQVKEGNVRLRHGDAHGGGPLFDLGIYCINAARSIFRAEPIEVAALAARGADPRFDRCEEMISAVLRFPGERLATFTCSFGASAAAAYRVVGTKGELHVDQAYEIDEEMTQKLKRGERSKKRKFARRDQFAPEILHFSDCIRGGAKPEPSGVEGLADVRVIRAILASIEERRAIRLAPMQRRRRPSMELETRRPPIERPPLVGVGSRD